jgi:hypothetical protein
MKSNEDRTFSQREGIKPVKEVIQRKCMDDDLRIGLWNALDIYCWTKARKTLSMDGFLIKDTPIWPLFRNLWLDLFKKPIDTLPTCWKTLIRILRDDYFAYSWNEVYDFIEFVANNSPYFMSDPLKEYSNKIMERELSAYRFVGNRIVEITSEEEIAEIEKALTPHDALKPVTEHLESALKLLADKHDPDYRNSIKESISAVEAICKIITDDNNATLGQCLKKIEEKIKIHPALKKSFSALYGYTSTADGIRHALTEEDVELSLEDARFMLVSCSSFINYLKVKASKTGLIDI